VLVGRRFEHSDAALLLTDDATGRSGWVAMTALDPTTTALVLEGSGSFVSLTSGGHALFVDRERRVAGEILAAGGAVWPSLTRTDEGIILSRDQTPTVRSIVFGPSVAGRFERQERLRPEGRHTVDVFAAEFGRTIAVTREGVEWAADRNAAFVEVGRWPDGDRALGSNASLGWIDDSLPAVVTPTALIARRCPVE
jgi:hypothetical protein